MSVKRAKWAIFLFSVIGLCHAALAVSNDQFAYHGYVRSGVGTNDKGGSQICVGNSGAGSNEFRLGNECGIYNEMAFQANHLTNAKNGAFFYSAYRLAMSEEGYGDWEDSPIALREVYAEGGRFYKTPYTFWAGKRFYRDNDIFMNDWYYYADMSGNGAGVGSIPFFKGNLAMAWLRKVVKKDPSGNEVVTNVGHMSLDVFDFRWTGVKLGEKSYLKMWLALAKSSSGVDVSTNKIYPGLSGGALAGLWELQLENGGFHHLALMYGRGPLNDFYMNFNLYEEGSANQEAAQKAQRARVVSHLLHRPSDKWAYFLASLAEFRDSGATSNSQEGWYSVGIRPIYFVNDHFQWTGQIGTSIVSGQGQEDRIWTRVSLGPQVALGNGVWSRPTITAFIAYNRWNDANKTLFNDPSQPQVAYQGETEMWNLGARMEVFF
ncbi:MAG: carbohydrate porin [Bdellovibrionales bacterium]|nr:carbohydrate porin [Bdellovibrionales bacterium]